ncbi:MAG TPA: ABC transporter ATP-binding protein [Alphaproteobacteria bacterium]|nr:ABC transporter ATP-binding protein [Alphaproteobacteria bacterium]
MHRPGLQFVANGLLLVVLGSSALGVTFLEEGAAIGWRVAAFATTASGAVILCIGLYVMQRASDPATAALPFAPDPDAMLAVHHLDKSFGGLKVIDNVSFSVKRGSRTALIGPNGAGKTTLFNLMTGVYPVDKGAIALDGANITAVPAMDRVTQGMSRSFQNIRLMPHLSTIENVMLGQHARARRIGAQLFPIGLTRGNRWVAEAEAALDVAGLETYPGQVVADLPYGIQKRIEVVRALISEPKVLLLDEPAAGLNIRETSELQALLRSVSDRGITLLVVEHDMHFVRTLCEYVVVLNFGCKIFEGTPEEVHQDRQVLTAYLGDQAMGSTRGAA